MPIPKIIKSKKIPEIVGPPPTLESFFRLPKPKAKAFVNLLVKTKATRFGDEDVQKAREAIRERPDAAKVIHDLAFAAYSCKSAEVKKVCIAEVAAFLDHQLRAELSWSPSDDESAESTFGAALQRFSGRKNAKELARSTSLLLSIAIWLHATKGLRGTDIAEALSSKAKKSTEADLDKVILTFLARPPAKPKGLVALATLVSAFADRAAGDRARATELLLQVLDLQERLQKKQSDLDAVTVQLAETEETLKKTEAALRAEQEQCRTLEMHLRNEISQLKGRVRGLLTGRVSRLLKDATDAASVSPISASVIRERLDVLQKELEGALQWLASE